MTAALTRNARLREVGTRNLVAAARHAGARRLIARAFLSSMDEGRTDEGTKPHRETDPLLP